MRRREFIATVGSAAAWPLVARGQQPERARRLGVLMGWPEADPQIQAVFASFKRRLTELGWSEESNLHIDVRWVAGDINRVVSLARELVALQPDAILAGSTPATVALQRETKTIPIVFVQVTDPIGSGFVERLSHPGGNITGFLNLKATLAEKWLELLKEIAPRTMRIAIMFNPQTAPYAEY
jgi:putative tryptophan/tyrosine transport system substrate-binding protein